MAHELTRLLAQVFLFAMIIGVPVMYIVFSDRFRRLPSPQQFSGLFAVVAAAGIILDIPALAVLASCVLFAIGLAWVSARYALDSLTYERELTPGRLFQGEEAELTVRLENRKLLPVAWVRVADPIDVRMVRNDRHIEDVLSFSGGIERDEEVGKSLVTRAAIGPFQSLRRTYRVKGLKRGVYVAGPAMAESGDPFGLFPTRRPLAHRFEIIVFPNVYSPSEIGLPFREVIGEIVPERALVEDPTFLAGTREYRPGDPLHRMHWKATARSGKLQVRNFDPSTTANLLILVNLNTYHYLWQGIDTDRMEATIDAAASLAAWSLDRGYAVGLRANGTVNGRDTASRIPPSAAPQQTAIILDHLARLSFSTRFPSEHVLADELRRLEARTSILFVTPVLTSELVEILAAPRLRGRVSVVYSGRTAAPVVRGLPIHLLRPVAEGGRAAS